MFLNIYFITWVLLAAAVAVLAVYRVRLGSQADESIHLSPAESSMIAVQSKQPALIARVERWGKPLTVVAVVYGLVLLVVWFYQVWNGIYQAH